MTLSLQRISLLPLALTALLLGGCSASSLLTSVGDILAGRGVVSTPLQGIQVVSMPDANQTSSTRVDIVFIYKPELKAMLPKKANEWFARKDEFHANLWRDMDIVSLEVPPAYVIDPVKLPQRYGSALQVTVFANYLSKRGRRPLDLTGRTKPRLTLLAKKMNLQEVK